MVKIMRRILLLCFGISAGLLTGEYSLRIYEKHSSFVLGVSQLERIRKEDWRWWGMASLERQANREPPHYLLSRDPQLFYEPNKWFYAFRERLSNNPGAYRIFVLGDSTTRLGLHPDLDGIYYPYQLEEQFYEKEGGKNKYIVVNCGIPGYGTAEEVRLLEKKFLTFNPDIVIIGYCLNDREVKHRIIERKGYYFCSDLVSNVPFCSALPFYKELYIHSELYKLMNYYSVRMCRFFKLPISYFDLGSHNTIKALLKLKWLSQAHNFLTLFVIFPDLEQEEDGEPERKWIRENLKKLGFDFIDMKNAFKSFGISKLKIAPGDRYHFNREGNALVAKELYRYIIQNNIGQNLSVKQR